ADNGRAAHPHVAIARPDAQARGELGMLQQQRPDERDRDRVGRRPVGGVVVGEPAFPDREMARREIATIARDQLDADGLHLEMPIANQRIGEREGVVYRPLVGVGVVYRSRERPRRARPDVVKGQIALAAEVAARVEAAAWPGETRERPPGVARSSSKTLPTRAPTAIPLRKALCLSRAIASSDTSNAIVSVQRRPMTSAKPPWYVKPSSSRPRAYAAAAARFSR